AGGANRGRGSPGAPGGFRGPRRGPAAPPPRLPTRSTAPSGSAARNSSATASAGIRCPPVPPPAINVRTTESPLTYHPREAALLQGPRAPALRRHVAEYPHLGQVHHQGGAPVADEGERDAGGRDQHGHRGDVDEGLYADPGGDPAGEQRPEAVGSAQRRPDPPPGQKGEGEHQRPRSDQAQLLADDREDEVGVGLGEPGVLQNGVAQPDPGETAPPQPEESLGA